MVSTTVIYVITWIIITPYLPIPVGREAEWPSWLTHGGLFTHKVVTSKP